MSSILYQHTQLKSIAAPQESPRVFHILNLGYSYCFYYHHSPPSEDKKMEEADRSVATFQTTFLSDKREELTEHLRSRLIECGWRDQVASMCRSLIQKHGVEQISLEEILGEVRPKARQIVPDNIKRELIDMMRQMNGQEGAPNTTAATTNTTSQVKPQPSL